MAIDGEPFATAREHLAQLVAQSAVLRALGLPENAVFQADTAESPEGRPFVVVRWGDEIRNVGGSWVRSVDWWVYDEFGDYNRASNIAKGIQDMGGEVFRPAPTASGWVTQLVTTGNGLGVGGDLADEGFDALVVPLRTQVVGRGA